MHDNVIAAPCKRIIQKFSELNKKRLTVPTITVVRLKKIIAEPDVDVRDPEEYRISRLPSALTVDELYSKFNHRELLQKRIVAYCTIGERSGRYIQRNLSKGYTWFNLIGGVLSWSHDIGTISVLCIIQDIRPRSKRSRCPRDRCVRGLMRAV